MLKWAGQALAAAAAEYRAQHGHAPQSITDLSAAAIVRQAVIVFERRNARLPSAGARPAQHHRLIEHLHLYLSVRCTDIQWRAHDIWDLRADPRIPQREHEPGHDQSVRIGAITPVWLKEGVRFWLRTALDAELLRWSSAVERARDMARHFGVSAATRGFTDPALTADQAELRLIFTAFTEYLRSPAAAAPPDKPLTPSAIDATQSQTQVFYTFMVDHAPEAAAATGDARWTALNAAHTRLWLGVRSRRANRHRELTWYSNGALQQMLHLPRRARRRSRDAGAGDPPRRQPVDHQGPRGSAGRPDLAAASVDRAAGLGDLDARSRSAAARPGARRPSDSMTRMRSWRS